MSGYKHIMDLKHNSQGKQSWECTLLPSCLPSFLPFSFPFFPPPSFSLCVGVGGWGTHNIMCAFYYHASSMIQAQDHRALYMYVRYIKIK